MERIMNPKLFKQDTSDENINNVHSNRSKRDPSNN